MATNGTKPTGLIFFPAFDWAISPTHPEREERLLYTRDQIFEEGVMDLPEVTEYKPRLATAKDIARVHFCVPDIKRQTTEAHLIASGAALVLADALLAGSIKNGFALVRPPGHHSMTVVHGNRGFCNINNEAIMVEYLRKKYGIRKVAIVDTDVHHGDGTQEIFWHDPDVLFISFHQDGRTLYPGSGFMNELGGPGAYGKTINIPLPPGTSDEGLHYVLDNLILPVLRDFAPDIIVNSAGQDNHYTDPLANMKISAQGYARLMEKLNPHLAVLEGGYAVESALPYVNLGLILALAGLDYSGVVEPDYDPEILAMSRDKMEQVKKISEQLMTVWTHRDELAAREKAKAGNYMERNKHIFYDTDYIQEEQQERIKNCPDCPGYVTIDSKAVLHGGMVQHIWAVTVPVTACTACVEVGRQSYEEAKEMPKYERVYLQDKKNDNYYCYRTDIRREWLED